MQTMLAVVRKHAVACFVLLSLAACAHGLSNAVKNVPQGASGIVTVDLSNQFPTEGDYEAMGNVQFNKKVSVASELVLPDLLDCSNKAKEELLGLSQYSSWAASATAVPVVGFTGLYSVAGAQCSDLKGAESYDTRTYTWAVSGTPSMQQCLTNCKINSICTGFSTHWTFSGTQYALSCTFYYETDVVVTSGRRGANCYKDSSATSGGSMYEVCFSASGSDTAVDVYQDDTLLGSISAYTYTADTAVPFIDGDTCSDTSTAREGTLTIKSGKATAFTVTEASTCVFTVTLTLPADAVTALSTTLPTPDPLTSAACFAKSDAVLPTGTTSLTPGSGGSPSTTATLTTDFFADVSYLTFDVLANLQRGTTVYGVADCAGTCPNTNSDGVPGCLATDDCELKAYTISSGCTVDAPLEINGVSSDEIVLSVNGKVVTQGDDYVFGNEWVTGTAYLWGNTNTQGRVSVSSEGELDVYGATVTHGNVYGSTTTTTSEDDWNGVMKPVRGTVTLGDDSTLTHEVSRSGVCATRLHRLLTHALPLLLPMVGD